MNNLARIQRFLGVSAGVVLLPVAANACPACMVGDPKTAGTYLGMTLIMSALPIVIACGLGYWLWRHHS